MTTISQPKKSASGFLWLVVVSALTLVGIGAAIYQSTTGMGVTNLSNLETWGVYVAGFIFFMGLSAGSLVLGALPVIFDLPKLLPYAKVAAFTGLASLIVGGLFIFVDIGQPMRLWHLVTYGRLGSPLFWDLLLTIAYLIISTVYLVRLLQAERKAVAPPRWMAYIALVAGLADGLTSFVFATQMAHEFWFSAIQPMAFEVAAIASAGGLLMIVLLILRQIGYLSLSLADLKPVAISTAVLLTLNLLLVASEVVTLAFGQSENGLALVNGMLASPLFWVEVIAFALAIFLLFVPQLRTRTAGMFAASVLTLAGLVAKRLLFVALGFAIPNISYPGVDIGSPNYGPSLNEWVLTLGLIGLFALILTIGFRALPLRPAARTGNA